MIHDLDHEDGLDPARSGAKAAWLARGRRSGLPILPGLVVDSSVSRGHMESGAAVLANRGSGGARLAMMAEPVPDAELFSAAAVRLGGRLVARSSTALEGSGEWSGAFASYVDIAPAELPKAVTGCWASAFTTAALQRQHAAGVEPGSLSMAVLVQRCLDAEAGGTAHIDEDGNVVVQGVKGSPAPLLQGWTTGLAATRGTSWQGDELIELVGTETLDEIAAALEAARTALGVGRCEWALEDRVWLLQLGMPHRAPRPSPPLTKTDPALVPVARAAALAPGRPGAELVMPWALAGLPSLGAKVQRLPYPTVLDLRNRLLEQVWGLPAKSALAAAKDCISTLLGPNPTEALPRITALRSPDPEHASSLLGHVRALLRQGPATRHGIGRWEPFVASVVLSLGARQQGTSASSGLGAGLRARIHDGEGVASFNSRCVVTAPQPVANLAPLLWDAAGVVTTTGSPAAHLFESARALAVPAVCGVELLDAEQLVAVDGDNGLVATLPLEGDPNG